MLGSYLDEHPLINLMKGMADCPFPSADDRAAWDALPADTRASLMALAQRYREVPYPMLTATQFMAFVRSGSRRAYEDPYFLRRRKLCAAFLGCCVSGGDDDLDSVIDGLWCILEETTWVISAHNGSAHEGARPAAEHPLPDPRNPYIDLFAAQTGMILSLICAMLGERLDRVAPLVRRRVADEIDRRILAPFMQRDDFWWMGMIRHDLCNWTPWIVSNVMLTATLQLRDRRMLAELLERACRMLDRYIAVLPQDGGCDEGAGYWNMAGGALLDCLELLDRVTGGAMTFWDNEKLAGIVSFPAKVQLENGWFVNFADCDARPFLAGERLQYAGEQLHDARLVAMGAAMRGDAAEQLSDTPQLWRLLKELFHPVAKAQSSVLPPRDVWLPDLQLRVLERGGMILAAKGGHNGESHNHNDVGSFMLYVRGEPAVVDAGNMIYTAKTFSDRRYELWNVRSRNHNLPLIGGMEQQPGREHAASQVERTDDGMRLDMKAAYARQAGVERLHRELSLDQEGCLTVTDDILLAAAQPVTWVFMLRKKPRVEGDCVYSGAVCLRLPQDMRVEVEEIPVCDERMARNFPGSLWRLACTGPRAGTHHAVFTFGRREA